MFGDGMPYHGVPYEASTEVLDGHVIQVTVCIKS